MSGHRRQRGSEEAKREERRVEWKDFSISDGNGKLGALEVRGLACWGLGVGNWEGGFWVEMNEIMSEVRLRELGRGEVRMGGEMGAGK